MIPKPIDRISESDLLELVSNEVPESRVIEYKEELKLSTDGEKKEFLADVSAFANSSGGDLIFGIKEKRENNKPTGIPEEAVGINLGNVDAEVRRVESIIRDGLDPRCPIQIRTIAGFSQGPVLILRVPKSWASPHMVILGGDERFYIRNNAGKHRMDVTELRSAFNLSEALADRIRRFRDERVGQILTDNVPRALTGDCRVILHFVPISSFASRLSNFTVENEAALSLTPLYALGHNKRYNMDGLLLSADISDEGQCMSYLQIYRNGVMETVDANLVRDETIPSVTIEQEIIKTVRGYLEKYRELGVQLPVYIFLTLLNVKGKIMGVSSGRYFRNGPPSIDRDILVLPEVVCEDYTTPTHTFLKPLFDALWQAVGWQKSINYNDAGEWTGGRR